MAAFDTHQAVRRLTASGMEEPSAEATVEVVGDATRELATKDDVNVAVDLAVAQLTAEMHKALRVQGAWIVGILTGLATIASAAIAIGFMVVG